MPARRRPAAVPGAQGRQRSRRDLRRVTAILALLVLGEPLGRFGGIGDALAVVGVAAAAMQTTGRQSAVTIDGTPMPRQWALDGRATPGSTRSIRSGPWSGLLLALASALTYGTGAFWLGAYAASARWLVSALTVYIVSVTVPLVALICRQQRPHGGLADVTWAVAAGLAEAVALVAFARGGQVGQVAVTAVVSSTYSVIPLAVGLVLFRERLSALPVLGICVAVTGLALVSTSTRVI